MRQVGGTSERLEQARAVLAVVENRQGIRAFHQRLQASGVAPGVYEVGGSVEVLASALREVFVRPAWAAFVGHPDVGWEAASQAGWDLTRIALVQCEPLMRGKVIGALLEGFDAVVTDGTQLAPGAQRTLAGKARRLNRVVLTGVAWPGLSTPIVPMDSGVRRAR